MRFACQSCGKAYNLPEEKIADKSNVKLKCRVCGAIVEVKRNGEVVASILGEADGKRTRVSEAPAPLTSLTSDDGEDATQAINVGEHSLATGEDAAAALMGHVQSALGQRGQVPLPPPPPTGFPTPVPPPLAPPEPAYARPEPIAPPLPGSAASPPPPLPQPSAHEASMQNGSGGQAHAFADPPFGQHAPSPAEPLPPPPTAPMPAPGPAAVALGEPGLAAPFNEPAALAPPAGQASAVDDTTLKMLAALVTGILIGFIISRLFF